MFVIEVLIALLLVFLIVVNVGWQVFASINANKKNNKKNVIKPIDEINKNYICLKTDPINSMNDLREDKWNMDKVREGLLRGMLRYAKQSEVERAKAIGRIK